MDELKVPLSKPTAIADGVSVWEWSGSAFDEGDEASKWFSNFIGKTSRLVRFNDGSLLLKTDYTTFCLLLCKKNQFIYNVFCYFNKMCLGPVSCSEIMLQKITFG